MALLLIVALISEMVLQATWSPLYFRVGLPIFKLRLPLRRMEQSLVGRFSSRFGGRGFPPLLFHRLSETEIAFRESLIAFTIVRYTPVMRGLILCRPEDRATYVIGYVNWYVVGLFALVLCDLITTYGSISLVLIVGVAVVIGMIYAVQAYRFRRVAALLGWRKTAD